MKVRKEPENGICILCRKLPITISKDAHSPPTTAAFAHIVSAAPSFERESDKVTILSGYGFKICRGVNIIKCVAVIKTQRWKQVHSFYFNLV